MNPILKKRLLDLLLAALVAAAATFLTSLLEGLRSVLPSVGASGVPAFAGAVTFLLRQS